MTPVLEIKNLKKSYKDKVVLNGLNFSLYPQEIVAFLGPNGAGKSTTLKMIMGLREPDEGQVRLLGSFPKKQSIKNKIGYTSQDLSFPAFLQVQEVLRFVQAHYSDPVLLSEILQRFELTSLQKEAAGSLSGGEKRRLGLACALIGKPSVLILDEPTTGLDIESRHTLWKEIRKFKDGGGTVLLSTHDLNEVSTIATRILLIDRGQIIVDGTVEKIKKVIEFQKISYKLLGEEKTELVQNSDDFIRKLVLETPHFSDLHIHPVTLEEAFLKIRGQL